jgi:hypothetical protein
MRLPSWFLFAALTLLPALARAASGYVDEGRFDVYAGQRLLGTEEFGIQSSGDSLKVHAATFLMLPGPQGSDSLAKRMTMRLGAFDFDLRGYSSTQKFRDETLIRGVDPRDTTYLVFREVNGHGLGDTYSRPPGRMFVLDGQLFTSFEVICQHLRGRTFDRRPLWLLALSTRDTMLQVEVTNLGADTLRWDGRAVPVRKLQIADSDLICVLWTTADGRMLQLEQPEFSVRVLRQAPPAKPARRKKI